MDHAQRKSAEAMRAQLRGIEPAAFRERLIGVSASDRDAWLDVVLGLDGIPEDEALPAGCVPYLPCSVETVLAIADHADVREPDVFVDIGSGVGRAVALMHLVTGAAAIGLEIQPKLVATSRELVARLGTARIRVIAGDAADGLVSGSVFLLYCPFGGARLAKVLAELETVATTRPIRVCSVDLPLPPCGWLELIAQPSESLSIYRSA